MPECPCKADLSQNAFDRHSQDANPDVAVRAAASDVARSGDVAREDLIIPYRLRVQDATWTDRVTGQTVHGKTVVSPDFNNEPIGVWTGDGRNGTEGTLQDYQLIVSRANRFAQIEGNASMLWVSPGEESNRAYLWNKEGNEITAHAISLSGDKDSLSRTMRQLGYEGDAEIPLTEQTVIRTGREKPIRLREVVDANIFALSDRERRQNQRLIEQLQQQVEVPDSIRQAKITRDQEKFENELRGIDPSQIGQTVESMVRLGPRLSSSLPFAGTELWRGRLGSMPVTFHFLRLTPGVKSEQLPFSPSLLFFPAALNLASRNDKKPFLSRTSQEPFKLVRKPQERKEPLLRQATKKEDLIPQVTQPERKLSRQVLTLSRKEPSALGAKFADSLKRERQEGLGLTQRTEVDTTQGSLSTQPLRLELERNELPQGVKGVPPLRWKERTQEVIVFETLPNSPSFRNHEERIKSGEVVSEEPEVKTVNELLTKYRDRVILSEGENKSGPNQTSVKSVSIEVNLSVNRDDSKREIKAENSVYIKEQKDKEPPEGLEPVKSLERNKCPLENKEEKTSEAWILNNLFRTFSLVVERKVAPQNELRIPAEQHHQKIEESFVFPAPLLLEVEPVNEPSRRLSLFNPQGLIVFYQALLYFQFSQIMVLAILYILRDLAGEEFTVAPSAIPCLENEIVLEYC